MPLYYYRPDDLNTPPNCVALAPLTDTYEEPQTPFECLEKFRPTPVVSHSKNASEVYSRLPANDETGFVEEAQELLDSRGLKQVYFGYNVDLINNIFAELKSQTNTDRCDHLAEPQFLARWLNNDITMYDLSTHEELLDEEDQAGLIRFGPCAKANMWAEQKEHWKDSERKRGRWCRARIQAAEDGVGPSQRTSTSQAGHSVQTTSIPSTSLQLQTHTLRAILEVKPQAMFPDWMITVLHKMLQYRSPANPSTQGFYLLRDEGVDGVYGFHLSIPDTVIEQAIQRAWKNDRETSLQATVIAFKRAFVNLLCQLFIQVYRSESEYLIFHNMSSTILLNRPDASSPFNFTVSPPIPAEGLGAPKVTLLTVLVALVGMAYDRETKRPGDSIDVDKQRSTKKPRVEDYGNEDYSGHDGQVSSDNHSKDEINQAQAAAFFPLSDLTFDERIFYPYPSLTHPTSLKTLHLSEPSSPLQSKRDQANFVLHDFIGLGALCKVYNGILHLPPASSSSNLHPHTSPTDESLLRDNTTSTTGRPAIIKVTDLYMFAEPPLFTRSTPILHDRSTTSSPPNRDQARTFVLNEAKIYQEVFSGSDVASEIVPRYYGLWTSHADSGGYKYEVMIQVLDEVGPAVAESWKTLDVQYVPEIERAFRALHSLGVIHGDIHPRHIRHCHHTAPSSIPSSRLMLIDFDRAKMATEEEIKDEWQWLQNAFNTWFPDRDVS